MAVDDARLRAAVDAITDVEGLSMDPDSLVEDVYLLAYAFPEDDDFEAAVANTCRALTALIAERVSASMLKYEFDTWSSYHYQPRVAQGARATCRIIFRGTEGSIESGLRPPPHPQGFLPAHEAAPIINSAQRARQS